MALFPSLLLFCAAPIVLSRPGFSGYEENPVKLNQTRGVYFQPQGSTFWPKGIVHYRFESKNKIQTLNKASQNYFRIAMTAITTATENCIQFVEDKKAKRKTGVIIYRSMGIDEKNGSYDSRCYSQCLGYCKSIAQELVATPDNCENEKHPGNYAGSVVHEIMHALGFIHEFARHDRDKYITFKKDSFGSNQNPLPDNTYNIPFNYKSIMQYDITKSITPKKNPPMKPLGKPKNLGQECRISIGDRNLIEKAYAQECRADKKARTFKTDTKIPGTLCKVKIDIDDMEDVGPMMG